MSLNLNPISCELKENYDLGVYKFRTENSKANSLATILDEKITNNSLRFSIFFKSVTHE